LFHHAQELFRGNDLEKAKAFLKLSSFLLFPLHEIEQIVISADEIIRSNFDLQKICARSKRLACHEPDTWARMPPGDKDPLAMGLEMPLLSKTVKAFAPWPGA
jgi:hypothetical protein